MAHQGLSLVASKFVVALTGFFLFGFIVVHMLGISFFYFGPEIINGYAEKLRDFPPLLWALRTLLLISLILHVFFTIKLSVINKKARVYKYKVVNQKKSSLSSRSMVLSGLVIMSFIFYHLAHFTFRWTHQVEFSDLSDFQAYEMMVSSFASPYVTCFYVLSVFLLMIHLSHGLVSFFQTFGFRSHGLVKFVSFAAPAISFILALGFSAVPLSVYFGVMK